MRHLIAFALMVMAIPAVAASLPELKIYTEHYKPYNFLDQDSMPAKLKGVSVDLLEAMLDRAGSDQTRKDFHLVAWENAYDTVKKRRNGLLFSAARTKEREDQFKWVCPIDQFKTELVTVKSKNISISSDDELNDYRIGAIRADVGEQLLKKAGVKQSRLSYGNEYDNLAKLKQGRIDLYATSMDNLTSTCENSDCDASQYKPVYTLNVTNLCFALNKRTPDSVVSKLQSALDELRAEGRVEDLKDKYSDQF
ncbi:substrate-binding periplasmic protein [Halomonadaceae bacterium KBTZ08]